MANSLRAKIKKLKYDGKISDVECKELINKLDGHDETVRKEIIDGIFEKALDWNMTSSKKVPYDFVEWLIYDMKKKYLGEE